MSSGFQLGDLKGSSRSFSGGVPPIRSSLRCISRLNDSMMRSRWRSWESRRFQGFAKYLHVGSTCQTFFFGRYSFVSCKVIVIGAAVILECIFCPRKIVPSKAFVGCLFFWGIFFYQNYMGEYRKARNQDPEKKFQISISMDCHVRVLNAALFVPLFFRGKNIGGRHRWWVFSIYFKVNI